MKPQPITAEDIQTIQQMHAAGWGAIAIANALGRNRYTIRRILRGQTKHLPRLVNGNRPTQELAYRR